jgi:hypothetical protein
VDRSTSERTSIRSTMVARLDPSGRSTESVIWVVTSFSASAGGINAEGKSRETVIGPLPAVVASGRP